MDCWLWALLFFLNSLPNDCLFDINDATNTLGRWNLRPGYACGLYAQSSYGELRENKVS